VIDIRNYKSLVDIELRRFMDSATKWALAAGKNDDFEEGLHLGHALGIYHTMKLFEIIDRDTAEELRAVLFGEDEA